MRIEFFLFTAFVSAILTMTYKFTKFQKFLNNPDSTNSNQKLKIEILVESLCPYSIIFIRESFANFFHKPGSSQLADVLIYPHGNAKEKFDDDSGLYKFQCQHGENECYGNLMQACAIDIINDKNDAFEFIICSFSNIRDHAKDFNKNLDFCLKKIKYDQSYEDKIHECTKSKHGNDLMHEVANKYPEHKYVPWIAVNGKFDEDLSSRVFKNMLEFVCENTLCDTNIKDNICNINVPNRILSINNDKMQKKKMERCENPFFNEK